MKSLITMILLCGISATAGAQNSVTGTLLKLDSVLSDQYYQEQNQWYPGDKALYEYDGRGHQVLAAYFTYDTLKAAWWGDSRFASKYDGDGNRVQDLHSYWDRSFNRWTDVVKSDYVYEDGLLRSETVNYWDPDARIWYSLGTWVYEYADGQLRSKSQSDTDTNYDGEINELDELLVEYFYDDTGNMIRMVQSQHTEDQFVWVPIYKMEYTYEDGRQTKSMTLYWDRQIEAWGNSSQDVYTYDAMGNLTSDTYSSWDFYGEVWIVQGKHEFNFGEEGNLISMIFYDWVDSLTVFVPNMKNEYATDSSMTSSDLILPDEYPREYFKHGITSYRQYDYIDGIWLKTNRGEIFYSEFHPSGIPGVVLPEILVFPNPASDFVTFTGNFSPGKVRLEILDLSGKTLTSELLPVSGRISVQHLSGGTYLYQLSEGRKVLRGRLVIR